MRWGRWNIIMNTMALPSDLLPLLPPLTALRILRAERRPMPVRVLQAARREWMYGEIHTLIKRMDLHCSPVVYSALVECAASMLMNPRKEEGGGRVWW